MVILSNQGQQNKDQTRAQIEKQDHKNEVELGSEFQIGNSGSQSQKKSGRQANKKTTELSSLVLEGRMFSPFYMITHSNYHQVCFQILRRRWFRLSWFQCQF